MNPASKSTCELSSHETGSGRAVVFIHGGGDDRSVWNGIAEGLARRYRVIAVDLPGHGLSPNVSGAIGVMEATDAVEQFFHRHSLVGSFVVGHSMGGAVAVELACRGVAQGIVAIAPIGYWTWVGARWAVFLLRATRMFSRMLGGQARSLLKRRLARAVLAFPFTVDHSPFLATKCCEARVQWCGVNLTK